MCYNLNVSLIGGKDVMIGIGTNQLTDSAAGTLIFMYNYFLSMFLRQGNSLFSFLIKYLWDGIYLNLRKNKRDRLSVDHSLHLY